MVKSEPPAVRRGHRIALALAATSPFASVAAALLLPGFGLLQPSLGFAGQLVAACALMLACAASERARPQRMGSKWHMLAALAAVVAGIVLLSSAVSASPAQALTYGAEGEINGAPMWLGGLLIVVLVSRQPLTSGVQRVFSLAFVLGALSGLVALFEALRGVPVTGGFGNADYLGMVMILLVPPSLVSARAFSGVTRWGFVATAGLMSLAAIAGGSSAVGVTLLAEWIALAIFAPRLFGRAVFARRLGVIALAASTTAASAAAFAALVAPGSSVGRLVHETIAGPTAQTRLEMWRVAYRVWLEKPLLGHGPDGLQLASQRVMTLDIARLESARYTGVAGLLRDPHSLPLMVLASVGIIGALAVAALVIVWIRIALSRPYSSARTAYVIATAAFGVCMVVMPWNNRFSALPALVAGLAIAPRARSDAGAAHDRPAAFMQLRLVLGGSWTAVAVATYLVAAVVAGDVLVTVGASSASPEHRLRLLHVAEKIQPTRPYLHFARLYVEGQRLPNNSVALETYRSDVESPSPVNANGVYIALLASPALDLYGLNRDPAALDWARERIAHASRLAPQNPDVLIERAHLAALTGDIPTAERTLVQLDAASVSRPRMLLYSYQAAVAAGRTAYAQKLHELLVEQAPELVPLANSTSSP